MKVPVGVLWGAVPGETVEHAWGSATVFGQAVEVNLCGKFRGQAPRQFLGQTGERCPVCTVRAGMIAGALPHVDRMADKGKRKVVDWVLEKLKGV